ncbi:hypothetical protein AMATHDRAFT_5651 [Amanita thiersii Skay4041]|uniref:Uncharacterized protein n=1 Tax=Amanita thiersii Skay4041 TaxID=703135 RepID=A0A2A9NH32_9AGAR|nr:hypothetical protein AMATHDRAFT_5651 [Amanita thiersii Skay4041]
MHLVTIAAAAAISFPTFAASAWLSCVEQSECKDCEHLEQLYNFSKNFCSSYKNPNNQTQGWASASSSGGWSSKNECVDAFVDIVSKCYGLKDGGKDLFENGSDMTVYFCNCEHA